ncbi:GlxA family transcriptional regulator [Lentzea flava]|uniref:AraC family transcriptional regulator n=1 Tax=Lentzea flava TaxID=103732 RepID=A0ABQ2V6H2_9PSEU|nr:helix-turn-helix domain-containing protein [Lentzea flava]MCP2203750.1 Transcriptional regulator GlxA family, contains an amidase domain and an AraC-type DNA-binding HTH domain [Lentzea flava]GGU71284.1 AraC family transcriptional regulator [Lentzea flava]
MHKVVAYVPEGVVLLDLGMVSRAFEDCASRYQLRYACLNGKSVRTSHRMLIEMHGGLELLKCADTIVVPAFTSVNRSVTPEAAGALRAAHRAGARLAGLSTGTFVLAEAGVLNDGVAAVDLGWADVFTRRFPQVDVAAGVPYTEWEGVSTSSDSVGTSALLRHLTRRGPGGIPVRSLSNGDESGNLAALREWIVHNLETPLPLSELSARAHLSQRTLTRRFRAETGLSPGQWILARRIDAAKALLETTPDTVDQIARAVGFSCAGTLRDHFKRMTGVTPANYRASARQAEQ